MPSPSLSSSRRKATLPIVVAVVAALVAAFAIFSNTGSPDSNASQPSPAASATPDEGNAAAYDELRTLERRTSGDPLARGTVDAPVVMINFSDFQCPFCGQFARKTESTLIDKYVKKGTLRIEWRDFPYLGEESNTAALAARAAAEQGGFWKFHDALYAKQSPPNSGDLTVAHLLKVAKSVGLDGSKLRADMKDPKLKAAIKKDFQEGQSIGVNGTPAFLINGRPVMGAQPLSVFEKAIEAAAADAR